MAEMTQLDPERGATPVLTEAFVQDLFAAVEAGNTARVFALTDPLSKEDFADLIELCQPEQRDALLAMVSPHLDPEVLPLLDENIREDVVEQMNPTQLVNAISNLDTDDAMDVIETMDQDQQREVLSALPMEERDALRTVLSYPEDSAGRLMQQEFMAVPEDWTVAQAADYIRTRIERPEAFYDIFVVNPAGQTRGSVALHHLLTASPQAPLTSLMNEQTQHIPVLMDQREVAYIFHRYGIVSAPVEDEQRRLVGMITIDDVIDIIEERATEELVHLSGVSEPDFYRDVKETARSRFTWLFVNLFTAILASSVISLFEGTLEKVVLLAVLMPMVASQGGNAGTQTLAVVVRGLALKELSWLNAWRYLQKEVSVGALNGVLFGLLLALYVLVRYDSGMIALTICLAMMMNLLAAAFAGTMIPLLLHRFKVDPAISSSALVTCVTDIVGFGGFLTIATLLLL